jgi:ribosomal protein S18 acetylase RimI-like enzyme
MPEPTGLSNIRTIVNQEPCTWRQARPKDDDAIVEMSMALYAEDPPARPVVAAQIRATLEMFREQPVRGRVVVLDCGEASVGYAFLVSFWSNELGGEICTIDELFIEPAWRGRGFGSTLLASLESDRTLWPRRPVAFELEVSPDNDRARGLYERVGYRVKRNRTMRRTS